MNSPYDRGGNTSGGETPAAVALSSEAETVPPTVDGERERKLALAEMPPADDVCPICFSNFHVPCRAPCGHWYCGNCILQYWRYSAALQPCKCPMCLQCITKLTPEASLYDRCQAETSKVLRSVGDYNRLFVGGIYGIMMKVLAIPLYIKRIFGEMLNPERPGVYLHEMRIILMLLGFLVYSIAPIGVFQIGRGTIVELLNYSAYALSFIFYLVGLYLRWKRERNIRRLAAMPEGHQD